jgi:LysM domain
VKKKQSLGIRWLAVCMATTILSAYALAQEAENIVETESGVYYTIQKGDTLWDLSERFSDTPWQWPGLWEENPQIPNPHLIYPGERVRLLYLKDIEEVEEVVETAPAPKQTIAKVKVEEPEKELPYYYYSSIQRVGFLKKSPINPQGTVAKVKNEKVIISVGDIVYISPDEGAVLAPGSRYTTYRTHDPLKDEESKEIIGVQYYLTGIIEIVKTEPQFAVAKVIKSFRSIGIDDYLMPYEKRSPKITLRKSVENLRGRILISEEGQEVIGMDHVVFIDKGAIDGVTPGQWYNIYYQENEKLNSKDRDRVLLPPVVFGRLIVLLSEETTSTALVMRAEKNILPGEGIRSPGE